MPVTKALFDEQNEITKYTITNNSNTLTVCIIDYGATLVNILLKDRIGQIRDVVLGFDDLDGYQNKRLRNPYFGATIGRVANRIATGSFELNGEKYQLPINSGSLTIHGGSQGFDKRKWILSDEGESYVTLVYTSEDGEEGFPGRLEVQIKFLVSEENELLLEYSAKLLDDGQLNKCTLINLTNHSYFNLHGAHSAESSQILDHKIQMLNTESYLEVDGALVPTGRFLSSKQTNFDFSDWRSIGERTHDVLPNGYDHCFVVEKDCSNYRIDAKELHCAVKVYSPQSGIQMTMFTTEPGFQFYAGSKIMAGHRPKKTQTTDDSVQLGSYSGFCLEAQRFPDAIHQPDWRKQVIVKPGECYSQTTVYKFDSHQCDPM